MNGPIRVEEVHFFTTVCGLSIVVPPRVSFPLLSPADKKFDSHGGCLIRCCILSTHTHTHNNPASALPSFPFRLCALLCFSSFSFLFLFLPLPLPPLHSPLSFFFFPHSPSSPLSLLHSLLILLLFRPLFLLSVYIPSLRLSASFPTLSPYLRSSLFPFRTRLHLFHTHTLSPRIGSHSPFFHINTNKQDAFAPQPQQTRRPLDDATSSQEGNFYSTHFLRLALTLHFSYLFHNNEH